MEFTFSYSESPPLSVQCFGYIPSAYALINNHLISTGYFSVVQDEEKDPDDRKTIPDIILTGFSGPFTDLSLHIQQIRSDYPNAAIIRCTPDESWDGDPSSFFSLFDGYVTVDFSSSSWGKNLVAMIYQALRSRYFQVQSKIVHEDTYQQIFEKNPIPLSLTIPETGTFVNVNKSFLQTYGYEREEVIGKRSFDLNIFLSQAEREEVITACTEQHRCRDREVRVRTKDNRIIPGLFSADTIFLKGRNMVLTTMKDISELKRVETELLDKNRFIQDILSSIDEGIIVYDAEMRYQVWNRYMEVLTGIPENQVIGRHAGDCSFKPQGEDIPLLVRNALAGITPTFSDVFYHVHETGNSGWISLIYTPYRDSAGSIIGVIASVRDISERKNAENATIDHEMQLRSIIDTIPVWIACLDGDGKITLANSAISSFFGLTPDCVEGRRFEDLLIYPRYEHHSVLLQKALSGREVPFNEEMEDPHYPDRKKYLRGRYSPLKGFNGATSSVVCVIIDITDLKTAQHIIERINMKLHLLSSITRHDILNSLTAILGYLSFAEDEDDQGLSKGYLKKSHQIALKIREQIEFTRDYQDMGVKEPVWQNAGSVFTKATRNLELNNIVVETSLDDISVYADPLLERVIFNLVDNALRYGKTVTQILSYWYQKEDSVIWVLEDNGAGIAPEMKELIFKKGFGHNTGLGLFLAREILDITNLRISETGSEGKGARFEMTIPGGLWKKSVFRDREK
jgi:PAS domain S-box-containing protein